MSWLRRFVDSVYLVWMLDFAIGVLQISSLLAKVKIVQAEPQYIDTVS